jgi:hypothetical protein
LVLVDGDVICVGGRGTGCVAAEEEACERRCEEEIIADSGCEGSSEHFFPLVSSGAAR